MKKTLIESFENIEDPRAYNISHKLIDSILISIFGCVAKKIHGKIWSPL